jgi:hypothetical protein
MTAPTLQDEVQLLRELDDAVADDLEDVAPPPAHRVHPRRGAWFWTQWRCPECRGEFRVDLERCPHDGAPLEAVRMSEPFLWLG